MKATDVSPARRLFWRRAVAILILGFCLVTLSSCADRGHAESEASSGPDADAQAEPSVRPAAVVARTVEAQSAVEVLRLPADLEADRRAVLAAEVSGRVDAARAEVGDRVTRGQALIAIDRAALAQQVAEAEALHRQSLITFDRAEKLLAKRAITQPQFLEAVTNRDVAAARLESARLQLEKSSVDAPWTGTVARRLVEVGDYVQVGQPLVELLDLGPMFARAPASAQDVPFLSVGTEAEIRIEGFGESVFAARVHRLGAALDPETRTLDVEFVLEAPIDPRLRPGMAAIVELPRQTLDAALMIPLAAAVEFEDTHAAYVIEDGQARRRTIELGTVIGDEVVVVNGLAAGEQVIVEGQLAISDGQAVTDVGGRS